MRKENGLHFDPDILDCMRSIASRFADIAKSFTDPKSDRYSVAGHQAIIRL